MIEPCKYAVMWHYGRDRDEYKTGLYKECSSKDEAIRSADILWDTIIEDKKRIERLEWHRNYIAAASVENKYRSMIDGFESLNYLTLSVCKVYGGS